MVEAMNVRVVNCSTQKTWSENKIKNANRPLLAQICRSAFCDSVLLLSNIQQAPFSGLANKFNG